MIAMGNACSEGGCFAMLVPSPRLQQLKQAKKDIRDMIVEKSCNPIMIRLAWHDSGTYDQRIKSWPQCGGANAGIRLKPEMDMGANAGLTKARAFLEPIAEKYPLVSWADLIQMASALAVEIAGGPKIPMKYGRVAIDSEKDCAGPTSREGFGGNAGLPDAKPPFGCGADSPAEHLRNVFTKKMGFNDQEIVALSGAHTVGRAFKERSGTCPFGYGDGNASKWCKASCLVKPGGESGVGMAGGAPWTKNWLTFDNSYFTQWKVADADDEMVWFPTDYCLHEDPSFKKTFDLYAQDQQAFFADYAKAHKKLSELGTKFDPPQGIRV